MSFVLIVTSAKHCRQVFDWLPSNIGRSSTVHKLLEAYELLKSPNAIVLPPPPASVEELCRFHDRDYIDSLLMHQVEFNEEYGISDDCPSFRQLQDYVRLCAGGSLEAARWLASGRTKIAINWEGGRHHAKRGQASGFCYVNDIVLAILELRSLGLKRILYLDIDLHHGDGVEEAFRWSSSVYTASMHRFDVGFFPGTGGPCCTAGKSMKNIPLKRGLSDSTFIRLFDGMLGKVQSEWGEPDAVVIVMGADGLCCDPHGEWNLTEASFLHVTDRLISMGLPTLYLGAGGYNNANCARVWTAVTARCLRIEPSIDIPEHENFYLFKPTFQLSIESLNLIDENV